MLDIERPFLSWIWISSVFFGCQRCFTDLKNYTLLFAILIWSAISFFPIFLQLVNYSCYLFFIRIFFSVRQMFNCWATHMATFWCWFGKANNFFCSILKCLFNFFSCWGMSSRHLATSAGYCLRTLLLFVKSFLFHFPFFSGLSVDLSADGIFCRVHFCN